MQRLCQALAQHQGHNTWSRRTARRGTATTAPQRAWPQPHASWQVAVCVQGIDAWCQRCRPWQHRAGQRCVAGRQHSLAALAVAAITAAGWASKAVGQAITAQCCHLAAGWLVRWDGDDGWAGGRQSIKQQRVGGVHMHGLPRSCHPAMKPAPGRWAMCYYHNAEWWGARGHEGACRERPMAEAQSGCRTTRSRRAACAAVSRARVVARTPQGWLMALRAGARSSRAAGTVESARAAAAGADARHERSTARCAAATREHSACIACGCVREAE
jgi:hypothetical protein